MNKILTCSVCLLSLCCLLSCSNEGTHKSDNAVRNENAVVPVRKVLSIDRPLDSERFGLGTNVPFRIRKSETGSGCDSLQLFVNDKLLTSGGQKELDYNWNSKGASIGRNRLKVLAWAGGKNIEASQGSFILLSDIVPKALSFKLVKTFPHDPKAYTQGLFYENGTLYESTGQWGESSLRKVNLSTGDVLQSVNLPGDIFGEGCAPFGDKLIQITWKSHVGFIYDRKTFQQTNKVYYQDKEGWGITFDGKYLIMSDGTEELSYYDTEYFTEQKQVGVYDDKGPVMYLNELEYIKGEIYANIYQQSRIAVIDPPTGKVKAYLDLESLVPAEYKNNNDRVLNGIAWNPATGHLYVTGKYWPSLFEIEVY